MFDPRSARPRRLAVLLSFVFVLAACGDSDGESATTSTAAPATTVAPTTSSAVQPDDGGDTVVITTAPATTAAETTAPETTAAPSTTEADRRPDGLILLGDGLGPLAFGDTPESAIEFLSAALGTPMADSGWTDSFSVYGTCPGTEVRGVEWPGFLALFGDADDDYSDGERHFMAYTVGWFGPDPFGMTTELNVGVGDSRDRVAEKYLSATFYPADELFNPRVHIETDRGLIEGFFDEAGTTLTALSAGTACGE